MESSFEKNRTSSMHSHELSTLPEVLFQVMLSLSWEDSSVMSHDGGTPAEEFNLDPFAINLRR